MKRRHYRVVAKIAAANFAAVGDIIEARVARRVSRGRLTGESHYLTREVSLDQLSRTGFQWAMAIWQSSVKARRILSHMMPQRFRRY